MIPPDIETGNRVMDGVWIAGLGIAYYAALHGAYAGIRRARGLPPDRIRLVPLVFVLPLAMIFALWTLAALR